VSTLGRGRVRAAGQPERGAPAERGQVLILWVLAATVILVIGAIVVDVGLWLTERRKAQLAADFAALAAATELKTSDAAAITKGREFAERNGFKHAPPGVEVDVNPNYGPDEVEVTIKQETRTFFTGIFGVLQLDIGARAVGIDPADELDVVMILDRSASIVGAQPKSPLDLTNAQEGAKAALQVFDPSTQEVALGVMWASDLSRYDGSCSFINGSWVPVRLTNDYNNAGSPLVSGIDCLGLSDQGTNWAVPIGAAITELQAGTPSARKAIILLADGHPQQPAPDPCELAVNAANDAKALRIEIYTIGYAIETDNCNDDISGGYQGTRFTEVLAAIATDSADNPGYCSSSSDVDAENADRDHFFCQHRFEDLAPIFTQIAEELARDYRLEE